MTMLCMFVPAFLWYIANISLYWIVSLAQCSVAFQIVQRLDFCARQYHTHILVVMHIPFFTNSALLMPFMIASSSRKWAWLEKALCSRDRAQS